MYVTTVIRTSVFYHTSALSIRRFYPPSTRCHIRTSTDPLFRLLPIAVLSASRCIQNKCKVYLNSNGINISTGTADSLRHPMFRYYQQYFYRIIIKLLDLGTHLVKRRRRIHHVLSNVCRKMSRFQVNNGFTYICADLIRQNLLTIRITLYLNKLQQKINKLPISFTFKSKCIR